MEDHDGWELTVVAEPFGVLVKLVTARDTFEAYSGHNERIAGAAGLCERLREGGILIGVFDGRAETLVHECVHAAMMILTRAGIDARNDSGEVLAHLTHWMFSQFSFICE